MEHTNREDVINSILKSQSQTIQDVSHVVYNMYKGKYVCISLKNNIWYGFKTHRWFEIDGSLVLKKHITTQVLNEYLKMIIYYSQVAFDLPNDDKMKDDYYTKSKNLTEITYKLRDLEFSNKIIRECQILFYDGQFAEKLDANPNLIGFENGVYDLTTGQFRDGRPEDYISLTTGNNYMTFTAMDDRIRAVHTFLSQILPTGDAWGAVMLYLTSCLVGRNPHQKYQIWLGSGGNGKSKLIELCERAMGNYASKLPISSLRKYRGQACPEIARLRGVRLTSVQDLNENETIKSGGIMKHLTSDEPIQCRPLFREPFTFTPQFKIVFCCNVLPPYDYSRRATVVNFNSRFVENPDPDNATEFKRDYHLSEKLYQWKEAFMYILLEHYKLFKRGNRSSP